MLSIWEEHEITGRKMRDNGARGDAIFGVLKLSNVHNMYINIQRMELSNYWRAPKLIGGHLQYKNTWTTWAVQKITRQYIRTTLTIF